MEINCVIDGLLSISSIAYKLSQAETMLTLPISHASISMVAPTQWAQWVVGWMGEWMVGGWSKYVNEKPCCFDSISSPFVWTTAVASRLFSLLHSCALPSTLHAGPILPTSALLFTQCQYTGWTQSLPRCLFCILCWTLHLLFSLPTDILSGHSLTVYSKATS